VIHWRVMLSVFPDVLFLAPFASFFLRVAVAILFGSVAWHHLKETGVGLRVLGAGEAVVALSLFFGAWAQPAALLGVIIAAVWLFQRTSRRVALSTVLLAAVICFGLILTGPGPFAFDLPL
jgi:hypothetical protein